MTYRISSLSPAFSNRIDVLRTHIRGDSLYKDFLGSTLDGMQNDLEFLDEVVDALQEAQRLCMIHACGLQNSKEFYDFYSSNELSGWHKQKSPPVERELIISLANKVYNMEDGKKDFGMVQIGEDVRTVAEAIIARLIKQNEKFDMQFTDSLFKAHLLNAAHEDGIKSLGDYTLQCWEPITKRMVVVPGMPNNNVPDVEDNKDRLLQSHIKPIHTRVMSGEIHYTLTCIPSPRDAEFDDISYEDYLQLFFEMCDQPWNEIDQAQQILITQLNAGNNLRFTNSDGTDLSLSIKGMTFANSIIARNVPGSEVFSAPIKDSANGKIIAKGLFSPSGRMKGERIEDIELHFEKGKCVKYSARIGEEHLKHMVETDEGSCFLGEVAIGTNPHLKRPVANISLVEKIGGSFHVALGEAYSAKEYMGEAVKFDNGNRSLIHWDITTMLHGKQGKIYLDDTIIMNDGQFLDPKLEILNHGWEAIPVEDRPDYWKTYDFKNRKY